MRHYFFVWLLICGSFLGVARAETYHLLNGQTVTGEIVSMDEKGILLKDASGAYQDRTPWGKITQQDLKDLMQNPKAAQFVEPFIDVSQEDHAKKTEVEIKTDYPHAPRPDSHSLIGAMFTSVMGLFIILVVYCGNLYAAYEISILRAQPVGLVCGVSAIAPVIGPIIFLSMPTKMKPRQGGLETVTHQEYVEPNLADAIAADQAAAAVHEPAAEAAPAQPAAPILPPTKKFARGQFTFNRRFFETQMPAFFAMTRPEAEKDKVLTVKSVRGTHIVQRFSKMTGTEIFLQVDKGAASEEVMIPFVEIQEVEIKHKDALS